MVRVRVLPIAAALLMVTGCGGIGLTRIGHAAPVAARGPLAVPMRADPRVGAVFLGGQDLHTCTGAVLAAGAGDLVLTAAHCLADDVEAYFVPGLAPTVAASFQRIDAVYLDPRWRQHQDPAADFAVARVQDVPPAGQQPVGYRVGPAPATGTGIDISGYLLGVGGQPVGCHARTAGAEQGFPVVRCRGLSDGTSGAPWVAGATVVGLVGGLDGGGCDADVSYSPPFDDAVDALVDRAVAGGPSDRAPSVSAGDC